MSGSHAFSIATSELFALSCAACTILRYEMRSSPQSSPGLTHLTVAARAHEYISASSPNESACLYDATGWSPACSRYTSYDPLSTT